MNAPKSVTFLTVPSIVSPSLILERTASAAAFLAATISCLQSPIIFLFLGSYSVITNVTSLPLYTDKSFTNVSEIRLAGINTLASSTITSRPPLMFLATPVIGS